MHTHTPAPSDADILEAYFAASGDLAAAARALGLSITTLISTLRKPHLADQIAAWKELLATQHHLAAMNHQAAAASALRKTIDTASDPVETRRAATTLARLATHMRTPPRTSPRAETAPHSVTPTLPVNAPQPAAHATLPKLPPITLDEVLAEVKAKRKRQSA